MAGKENFRPFLKEHNVKQLHELSLISNDERMLIFSTIAQGVLGIRPNQFDVVVEKTKRKPLVTQLSFAHLSSDHNNTAIAEPLSQMFGVGFNEGQVMETIKASYGKSRDRYFGKLRKELGLQHTIKADGSIDLSSIDFGELEDEEREKRAKFLESYKMDESLAKRARSQYFGKLRKEMNIDRAVNADGSIDITKINFSALSTDEAVKRASFLQSYIVSKSTVKRINEKRQSSKGDIIFLYKDLKVARRNQPKRKNTKDNLAKSFKIVPLMRESQSTYISKMYENSSLLDTSTKSPDKYQYCDEEYDVEKLFFTVYGGDLRTDKNKFSEYISTVKRMMQFGYTFTEIEDHVFRSGSLTNKLIVKSIDSLDGAILSAYQILLQRNPSEEEITDEKTKFKIGYPIENVMSRIFNSPEYKQNMINKLFRELLGRNAEQAEINSVLGYLTTQRSFGKVVKEIKEGLEYHLRGRKSNIMLAGKPLSLHVNPIKQRFNNLLQAVGFNRK